MDTSSRIHCHCLKGQKFWGFFQLLLCKTNCSSGLWGAAVSCDCPWNHSSLQLHGFHQSRVSKQKDLHCKTSCRCRVSRKEPAQQQPGMQQPAGSSQSLLSETQNARGCPEPEALIYRARISLPPARQICSQGAAGGGSAQDKLVSQARNVS